MIKIIPILILLISCGFKTPPEPYPSVSDQLKTVSQERVYFNGNKLVIEWNHPKITAKKKDDSTDNKSSDIYLTSINVITPNSCPACEDQMLDKISIIKTSIGDYKTRENFVVWKKEKNGLKIVIPNLYLTKFNKHPIVYFSINYHTRDGNLSPNSIKLYPKQPVSMPVPEIKTERFLNQQSIKNHSEILIRWKPVLEQKRHVISDDQQLKIINKYYGLVLFKKSAIGNDIIITKQPLVSGQFMLSDISDNIWAKYQDRYGNYSEEILINIPKIQSINQ